MKKAGYAVITATAKDTTGSTYSIPIKVVDYSSDSVVLGQTGVTVNTALKEQKAEVKVYNGFGGKLTAVTFNGKEINADNYNDDGTIFFTVDEKGKGTLKVTVSDEKTDTEVTKEFKNFSVKESYKAPKVTIKQLRNLNAQYKAGYAQFMIGADGVEISDVTVEGLDGYCSYDKESKILTLSEVTAGAKKENFKVSFDDYTDIVKQVSVKQDKESFKLGASSGTVYTGLAESMEVQLLNKKTSVAETDFEVLVDNNNYTVKNENGVVVIKVKDKGIAKNNDKLTLTFSNENVWRNDIIQTFKVKVVTKEKAALELGSKNVTLYNYKNCGVISQTSTSLMLNGGSSLAFLNDEQVIIEGEIDGKLSAQYENGRILITAGEGLNKGNYSLQVKAGNLNPVTLKVKVVDVEKANVTATVKKSGSIDVLNRNGSNIVLKGSFKNVAKDAMITKVRLTGRDAYLFEIASVNGKDVAVQLKDNVAVISKYAYKVGVEYTIDCPGDKDLVLNSQAVDVKLSQKKPKVKVEGDGICSNMKDESTDMKVVLYNSTGVKIDVQKVKLLNYTRDFAYDLENGKLIHKADGETAIGKTYSLKFEVVAKEGAENEKPVTVVYKVKVVK